MNEDLRPENRMLKEQLEIIVNENKKLKEELENDIDRYEDTISYQLGFDKGKEYMQQRITKAIDYIKNNTYFKDNVVKTMIFKDFSNDLLDILGDKE